VEQDALPEQPIIASVPMSIRSEGDVELGNKLTTLFTSLETQIVDPVERLRSIAEKMHAAKEIGNALKAKEIRRLSESVVPGLANLGWRAYQAANLEAHVPNPSNLIVSNVPGPPIPLYTCGARILALHPVPPVVLSQGLNVTVMSYLDSVDFGFTVDREMIPDPWAMAEGVHVAVDELKTAAKSAAR
jgi:WS/DGAT/MGAT family acyltransferase